MHLSHFLLFMTRQNIGRGLRHNIWHWFVLGCVLHHWRAGYLRIDDTLLCFLNAVIHYYLCCIQIGNWDHVASFPQSFDSLHIFFIVNTWIDASLLHVETIDLCSAFTHSHIVVNGEIVIIFKLRVVGLNHGRHGRWVYCLPFQIVLTINRSFSFLLHLKVLRSTKWGSLDFINCSCIEPSQFHVFPYPSRLTFLSIMLLQRSRHHLFSVNFFYFICWLISFLTLFFIFSLLYKVSFVFFVTDTLFLRAWWRIYTRFCQICTSRILLWLLAFFFLQLKAASTRFHCLCCFGLLVSLGWLRRLAHTTVLIGWRGVLSARIPLAHNEHLAVACILSVVIVAIIIGVAIWVIEIVMHGLRQVEGRAGIVRAFQSIRE